MSFDGNKDLFITNGIKENTNDNDLNEKLKSRQKRFKSLIDFVSHGGAKKPSPTLQNSKEVKVGVSANAQVACLLGTFCP